MPFTKWSVEPVLVCRKPLPPDKKREICDFETTTNLAFANCLRQLASVAKIADQIFVEIASECRLIAERTEKLKEKITSCRNVVDKLNAREVQVPVSNLSETSKLLQKGKHYTTKYEQTTQLFLPSTRPPCVDNLYGKACTSPVAVMCTIDQYRTDGLSASELFMVTPILGGTRKKRRKLLDIETRKPANFSLVKTKQDRIQSGSASLPPLSSSSFGYTLKQNENLELERLPSPEEQAMLVSLEYPSTVVTVDTSGTNFTRMTQLRRSLMHADFIIKRKKSKKRSKRRHTFCEGDNRNLEKALRNVTHTSCQTDGILDVTTDSSSTNLELPSLSKRHSCSVQDNLRQTTNLMDDLNDLKHFDSKDTTSEENKEKTAKGSTATMKKSKSSSLRSRAYNFNPISSLSAVLSIAAVKMRNSTRMNKHDDGCSSSGNWSASSSTRASVDSDHHQIASPVENSPSRNSVGKDSVLSDATQQDPHNRSRDDVLPIQSLTCSPMKQRRFQGAWDSNNMWISNNPTPDVTSQSSSSTPHVRSPYAGRHIISDDGDSSVYSVDTDGYYTSMHTDSGLWTNIIPPLKSDDVTAESAETRKRQESQSSVSTIDNSSINSFLSKSATECSSNSDSLKRESIEKLSMSDSTVRGEFDTEKVLAKADHDTGDSDKSYSPHPQNGSISESDHEVGDRIRAKTAISANRYPSMCAVSPETSDDEIAELRRKNLSSNVNVTVAEIHWDDRLCDISDKTESQSKTDNSENSQFHSYNSRSYSQSSNSSINMYRSETPLPLSFSSTLPQCEPVSASTPRSGINITTFSPDISESVNPHIKAHTYDANSLTHPVCNSINRDDAINKQKPSTPHNIDKSLIPLKYAQRITVTPVARRDPFGSNIRTVSKLPSLQYSNKELNVLKNKSSIIQNPNKVPVVPTTKTFDQPTSSITSVTSVHSTKSAPSPTNSLSRPIARVTLDPTGNVVYSSNSLERPNNSRPNKIELTQKASATLPTHQTFNMNKPIEVMKEQQSSLKQDNNITQIDGCYSKKEHTTEAQTTPYNDQTQRILPTCSKKTTNEFSFRPSRGGRFCRSYFPSHLLSTNSSRGGHQPSFRPSYAPQESSSRSMSTSYENFQKQNHSSVNSDIPFQNQQSSFSHQTNNHHIVPANQISNSVPNTEVAVSVSTQPLSVTKSGIWPGRNYSIISNNRNLNLQGNLRSELSTSSVTENKYNSLGSLSPPDLIPSGESLISTLDITSPANSSKNQEQEAQKSVLQSLNFPTRTNLKSLSANELFAIIHNSKKKHNIKTESEKSMSPLSSRSVSPALSQNSLSKLSPVETGVLIRRIDNGQNLMDKSKWCNSLPSSTFKKPAVQEKLNTKPTSMHDFKMLLLQTRTGTPNTNSRPSAAELLKVSPPKTSSGFTNSNSNSSVPSTLKSSNSHFNQGINYSPGHSTVPSKRIMRTRSPYLTRYDSAYPPIIEDCLEETESYENIKNLPYKNTMDHESKVKPAIVKATSTWV